MQDQSKRLRFAVAVTVLSAALAACGGGGGGGESTAATPPNVPSNPSVPVNGGAIAPVTSVPTPTYAAGSMQLALFNALNTYRSAMGVGLVAQDTIIDTAAQAQALYLDSNLASGAITALDHNEISTNANFYDTTPLARALKAGTPATEWISEDIAAGVPQANAAAYAADCLNNFVDSVYHMQSIASVQQTVGIGFQQSFGSYVDYTCAFDFGETAGVVGAPQANSVYIAGGQQLPASAVAVAPLNNETGVLTTMRAESPNPAPDLTAPGHPIMYHVNAAAAGDVLTVQSFTLTTGGTTVPARIIVPQAAVTGSIGVTADVNNEMFPGYAFLLPLAALTPNTTYTVNFQGERDGTPTSKSWSFTTGAI